MNYVIIWLLSPLCAQPVGIVMMETKMGRSTQALAVDLLVNGYED